MRTILEKLKNNKNKMFPLNDYWINSFLIEIYNFSEYDISSSLIFFN